MKSAQVLSELNEQKGRSFQLVQKLAGSQGGSYEIAEGAGRAVMKWWPDPSRAERTRRAASVIEAARAHGWPTPEWLLIGVLSTGWPYVVQAFVEGKAIDRIGVREVEAVIAANDAQANVRVEGAFDWANATESAVTGVTPWRDALQDFSTAGRDLVTDCRDLIREAGAVDLPRRDIVHGDYSPANILWDPVDDGVVFVDAETIGVGTRVIDLADLLRSAYVYGAAPDAKALLTREAAAIDGVQVLAWCAVGAVYGNMAWSIEHSPPNETAAKCDSLFPLIRMLRATLASDC